MVFSSLSFLYVFLPIMLLLYYLTPRLYRNYTLLLGSLIFYFIGEPKYVLLLIISTIVDYTHSKIIDQHRGKRKAKIALISSIVINLGMLIIFKYADFFIVNINSLLGLEISLWHLKLPIGISFFTFQTMSYTIDVYRNEAPVQKNIFGLATYVTLFPQLIAGPIVRYKSLAEQISERTYSLDTFGQGVRRFIVGLSKKVLIANVLGELSGLVATGPPTSLLYWMSAIAFTLQIYFDFSGYSDMAIGLGQMFGFHFPENFNYPLMSKSITEFWRRWHISLGQWFRDYLYIPLGGNRKGSLRWIFNIFIVWFLTGFWHGASWNFVLWGLSFAIILVVEKLFLLKVLNRLPALMTHVYVLLIVVLSFVIFRNDSLLDMYIYFKGMFGFDISLYDSFALYYLKSYLVVIVIGMFASRPWKRTLKSPLILALLMIIITGYLVDSSFNPFLYFRF